MKVPCTCGLDIDIPPHVFADVQRVQGECLDCGATGDAPGHETKALFFSSWIGRTCYERNPRDAWAASEKHNCPAQLNIQALSGCIITPQPRVVEEGVFWLKTGDGVYTKHRIMSDGGTKILGEVRTKT